MARKEPPRDFDPHPGDPWHPRWSAAGEAAAEAEESDEAWWKRMFGRRAGEEAAATPDVYASLPAAAAEPPEAPPAAAETPDPDSAAEPASPVTEPAEAEPIGSGTWEPAAQPAARAYGSPWTDGLPAEPTADGARRVDDEAGVATIVALAERLEGDAVLANAEQMAHEEAAMWAAVGRVRAEIDAERAAAYQVETARATHRYGQDRWEHEAVEMEEALQRANESRELSEAEVRRTLDQVEPPAPETAGESDGTVPRAARPDPGARFAALAAELHAANLAEVARTTRREELRLDTSLLLLDADSLWESDVQSRPGSSLRRGGGLGTAMAPAAMLLAAGIATRSAEAVPESIRRRRWPRSRRRRDPATPNAPQDALRSVIVVEERSVSGREDGKGVEGQEPFAFDDSDPGTAPEEDLMEEELAAWSELDWDDEVDEADPVAAGGGDQADTDEPTVIFDGPDPGDAGDGAPLAGPFDIEDEEPSDEPALDEEETTPPDDDDQVPWEEFTAEEYVQTATQEYADLAAAIAAAEGEEAEQAAIAADIPGLEGSLVGLEDVVSAEGLDAAEAAPERSDLTIRVLTALGLVILFFASLTYHWAIGLLVLVVMAVAAGEMSTSLVRVGRHPVALFSYLGTLGALLGTWAFGLIAVPVSVAATILAVALYFGLVAQRQDPLTGMALTVMVVLWIGVMAAFAMDMVNASEYRWLIASIVVIVAAMDIAQYFVGKRFGRRPLAPIVSPKKTVAGLVGGIVVAVAAGFALSYIAPYDEVTGLALGGALAITGPLGDLAVSVLKRSMSIKDMGTILPGHGGVVDRIDAILFSLPAAWLVFAWAGLLV